MTLRINDTAPDFEAQTTQGPIKFHDWIGNGWAILFSHPKDFTPICTTELGAVAAMKSEFDQRNTKVIGISVDAVTDHEKWSKDIEKSQGHAVNYPLIGDPDLKIVKAYDMLPAEAGDTCVGRTPADNATARSVFIIGPDKKIKATLTYPMSTGRNFLERDLDGSTHGHLVRRDAGKVRVEVDAWILVERDQREVVGLIGHAAVQPAVLDDDIRGDMALSGNVLPREPVGLGAHLAARLRRILQLVARSAVLQDEAPLVHRIPERLAQFIGYRNQLGHRVHSMLVHSARRTLRAVRSIVAPAATRPPAVDSPQASVSPRMGRV